MAIDDLKLGWQSTIEMDTGSNNGTFSSSVTIGGFTSGSLTPARTNPDSTNIDTAGFQGREYGIRAISFTGECLDDQATDTFQDNALTDYHTGVKRWLRIRPRVGTGHIEWIFKAVWSTAPYTIEQGGIVRFSITGESDGTITKQDQT